MFNTKIALITILSSSVMFVFGMHVLGAEAVMVPRPPSAGANAGTMYVGDDSPRPQTPVVRPPSSGRNVPTASVNVGRDEPRRAEKPKAGLNISVNIGTPPPSPVIVTRPIVVERPTPRSIIISGNSAIYPYATLAPVGISNKGDRIRLDDGSDWKVRHRHYNIVRAWRPSDFIMVETSSYFKWSSYKLVNYTRKETVDVELIEPASSGMLSHWIAEIRPYDGYVRLQDGSIWQMSKAELRQWRINDDVIVGLTKDWFSNEYTYTLVNPRVKKRLVATFSAALR